MERVLSHCTGQAWNEPAPEDNILGKGWDKQEGTPVEGSLRHIVVIRPALLTDGECLADKYAEKSLKKPHKPQKVAYKFGTDEELGKHNGYTVSRKDVAHFMVEEAVPNWDRFEGKRVNVCY